MITVSAFRWVPPFAQGLVRDLRVRWALEEAGLPYEARIIGPDDQSSPDYRALQPFGQVPAYEEGGLTLFESGAIVLHIAEKSGALMPADPAGRARTVTWVFAALNSLEPFIQNLSEVILFPGDAAIKAARRPELEARVSKRLGELAEALGDKDYLEDRFTAGDLMMTTVLRNLRHTSLLEAFPSLVAYKQRCEARPPFAKALDAQLAVFKADS